VLASYAVEAVAAAAAADMAAGEEIDSAGEGRAAEGAVGLEGVDSDWGSLDSEVDIGSSDLFLVAGAGHTATRAAGAGTATIGSRADSLEGAAAERAAAGLGSALEVPPSVAEVLPLVVEVHPLEAGLPSARAAVLVAVLQILLAEGVSREGLLQNRLSPEEVRILRALAVRLCLGSPPYLLETLLSPYLDPDCDRRTHCRGCDRILAGRLSSSRPFDRPFDRGRSPGRPAGHTASDRLGLADSVDLESACDRAIRISSARSASADGLGVLHYSLCSLVFPLSLLQAREDDLWAQPPFCLLVHLASWEVEGREGLDF